MAKADQGIVLDEKAQAQPKDKQRAQGESSRKFGGQASRKNTERDRQNAIIEEADKTDCSDRDRAHGDGKASGIK